MRGKRNVSLAFLGLSLGSLACATVAPYDPFQVPAAELRARVDTIALMPLRISSDLADPTAARAAIEPRIVARLEGGGFRVIPSAVADELWRAAAAAVGDVFDPKTGTVVKERFDIVDAAVNRELAAKHGVDAVLYSGVETVDLPLVGDAVVFCGKSGRIYWPAEAGKSSLATFARAACLNTTLYDLEDRRLYAIRYGIATTETYRAQTHAERPPGALLSDADAIDEAVRKTLAPLAGEPPPAE